NTGRSVFATSPSPFRKTMGNLRRDDHNRASTPHDSKCSNDCLERMAPFPQSTIRALCHMRHAGSCARAFSALVKKRMFGQGNNILVIDCVDAFAEIVYSPRDQSR